MENEKNNKNRRVFFLFYLDTILLFTLKIYLYRAGYMMDGSKFLYIIQLIFGAVLSSATYV